jgi:flagellar biosynthetic protein FliO
MRIATVLVPEAGRASGPDLTRYLVVCAGAILALVAAAWLFRRFVGASLRARAARRSLRIVDVLPLSGKQKLVVVRCYDRSFLLGLGEKEVRAIAELDGSALAAGGGATGGRRDETQTGEPVPHGARSAETAGVPPFPVVLDEQLLPRPAATRPREALGSKEGVLA